jgi:hypothetical protein
MIASNRWYLVHLTFTEFYTHIQRGPKKCTHSLIVNIFGTKWHVVTILARRERERVIVCVRSDHHQRLKSVDAAELLSEYGCQCVRCDGCTQRGSTFFWTPLYCMYTSKWRILVRSSILSLMHILLVIGSVPLKSTIFYHFSVYIHAKLILLCFVWIKIVMYLITFKSKHKTEKKACQFVNDVDPYSLALVHVYVWKTSRLHKGCGETVAYTTACKVRPIRSAMLLCVTRSIDLAVFIFV